MNALPSEGTICAARTVVTKDFYPCKIVSIAPTGVTVTWTISGLTEELPSDPTYFELCHKRQRVQRTFSEYKQVDSDTDLIEVEDQQTVAGKRSGGRKRPNRPVARSRVAMKSTARNQSDGDLANDDDEEEDEGEDNGDGDGPSMKTATAAVATTTARGSPTRSKTLTAGSSSKADYDDSEIDELLEDTEEEDDEEDEEDEEDDDEEEEEEEEEDVVPDAVGIRKRGVAKRHQLTLADVAQATRIGVQTLSQYRDIIRPFINTNSYNILLKAFNDAPKDAKLQHFSVDNDIDLVQNILRVKQPDTLTANMREYQLTGLSWLVNQYKRGINSILADEMGLGKTLQSIAFIAHLMHVEKVKGPHLVVVPLSVLFNWMQEFKKFCPSVKVIRLHANDKNEQKRMRTVISDASITEVVVTTYDLVKAGGLMTALKKIIWNSIILDEGHRIKNDEAQVTRACCGLRGRFRLILTGTPVQNNLHESWVLLTFLFPSIFTESSAFDDAFDLTGRERQTSTGIISKNDMRVDRNVLSKAHYMMRPFILRRLKTEVEGKLPPKLETKISCPMSKMQRFWIQRLLYKERASLMKIDDGRKEGGGDGDWRKLQSIMAQLRKAANHPYLFPGVETVSQDGQPTEEIITASGKMVVLDRLLKALYDKGHRVVLFSQYTKVLDILSDYLDWRGYKHNRLDGQTNRVMREVLINQFNKPGSPYFIFCLSTRAGGEGVNLFTADTVILFDSDWNPQVDLQAMARVHRIGQTKVVHIYRLVTVGSVEERIVQRAQKKLFLDGMVNRGSTAQARALDSNPLHQGDESLEPTGDINAMVMAEEEVGVAPAVVSIKISEAAGETFQGKKDEPEEPVIINTSTGRRRGRPRRDCEEEERKKRSELAMSDAEVEQNKFLAALKFGWNSVFSASSNENSIGLTDEQIELIIDRTRGLVVAGEKDEKSAKLDALFENQQVSLTDFDETAPLISVREFDGMIISGKKERDTSMEDIAAHWREVEETDDEQGRGKRSKVSRMFEVEVDGVGTVQVLKSNDYDLNVGEPSVQNREMAGTAAKRVKAERDAAAVAFIPTRGRQIAGRDFSHQEHCQNCWDGGELLLCGQCPAAYHLECLGFDKVPSAFTWSCPHHSCCRCMRKSTECGLLFRCEICPNAYCEDCMPVATCDIKGTSERFAALGFRNPSSCCFCVCSQRCAYFAANGADPPTDEVGSRSSAKAPKQRKKKKVKVEVVESEAGNEAGSSEVGEDGGGTAGASTLLSVAPKNMTMLSGALKSNPLDSLESCRLTDISVRLTRAYDRRESVTRYTMLSELPNFVKNWASDVSPQTRVVFKMLIDKIHEVVQLDPAAASMEMAVTESAERDGMDDTDKCIFEFSGVPPKADPRTQAQAFIDVVRILSTVPKNIIIQLARVCGILHYSPVLLTKKEKESLGMGIPEPKFRLINESTLGNRAKVSIMLLTNYLATCFIRFALSPLFFLLYF